MVPNSQPEKIEPAVPTRRLFFAVELAPEVRAATEDLSARLQKAAQFTRARISWVPADNFHITLFFLGDIPEYKGLELKELLPDAVAGIDPFPLDVRHVGTFPKDQRKPPRVLWLGVHQPSEMLHRLRKGCASIILRAGLPLPDQDFSPHLTLARFRSTAGLGAFSAILREYSFFKAGKGDVTRLVLMESITGGGPARYVPYATADFGMQETAPES